LDVEKKQKKQSLNLANEFFSTDILLILNDRHQSGNIQKIDVRFGKLALGLCRNLLQKKIAKNIFVFGHNC